MTKTEKSGRHIRENRLKGTKQSRSYSVRKKQADQWVTTDQWPHSIASWPVSDHWPMTTQSTSYIASLHTLLAASVYIVYDRHKSFLTSFTGVICIASIKLHRVTACVDSQRSSCQFNFGFHFIPLQKKITRILWTSLSIYRRFTRIRQWEFSLLSQEQHCLTKCQCDFSANLTCSSWMLLKLL